jgi:hypothetical protein
MASYKVITNIKEKEKSINVIFKQHRRHIISIIKATLNIPQPPANNNRNNSITVLIKVLDNYNANYRQPLQNKYSKTEDCSRN